MQPWRWLHWRKNRWCFATSQGMDNDGRMMWWVMFLIPSLSWLMVVNIWLIYGWYMVNLCLMMVNLWLMQGSMMVNNGWYGENHPWSLLTGAFHAGNGWEWGLLGLSLTNHYGSFPHSLCLAPVGRTGISPWFTITEYLDYSYWYKSKCPNITTITHYPVNYPGNDPWIIH